LFDITHGFKNVSEIISDEASQGLEKSLAGAFYKVERWRNGDKKTQIS